MLLVQLILTLFTVHEWTRGPFRRTFVQFCLNNGQSELWASRNIVNYLLKRALFHLNLRLEKFKSIEKTLRSPFGRKNATFLASLQFRTVFYGETSAYCFYELSLIPEMILMILSIYRTPLDNSFVAEWAILFFILNKVYLLTKFKQLRYKWAINGRFIQTDQPGR